METLAWFTTFLIGLVVALMLAIAVVLLPRTVRTLTARFYCPWARRNVFVRYLTCDGQHPMCVMSCTAFADPSVVTCGMPCLAGAAGAAPHGPAASDRGVLRGGSR